MKYWCSVCFGWRYWCIFVPVLLVCGWFFGQLVFALIFAGLDEAGRLVKG